MKRVAVVVFTPLYFMRYVNDREQHGVHIVLPNRQARTEETLYFGVTGLHEAMGLRVDECAPVGPWEPWRGKRALRDWLEACEHFRRRGARIV